MNMVPEKSGAIQVGATPGSWQTMGGSQTIDPGASGYVLVYLSNAQHLNVWFDNFNISFYKGELLQEEHYYPYGLNVNEGQDVNAPPNKFLFQGNQRNRDFGLNLNDFNFRQYDAQIGRFNSTDLLADGSGQEMFSPYHFCANDPANFVDPWGLGTGKDDGVGLPNSDEIDDGHRKGPNEPDQDKSNPDPDGWDEIPWIPEGDHYVYYFGGVHTRPVPSVNIPNMAYDFSWVSYSSNGYYGADSYHGSDASVSGGSPGGGNSSPNKDMRLSERGYGFVKAFEKFKSHIYDAGDGLNTIGYGYVIPLGQEGKYKNGISEPQATALMHEIMPIYENQVKKYITVPLTQAQFDALTIFTYNMKGGLGKQKKLIKAVNDKVGLEQMRKTWYLYGNGTINGKFGPVRGLMNRRVDEFHIWECIDYIRDN